LISDEGAVGVGTLTYVKEDPTRTYDLRFITAYACPLNPPSPSPSPNPRGDGTSPAVLIWAIAVMATQGAVIVGLVSMAMIVGVLVYLRSQRRTYSEIN
jgi:hypothetical protein